MALHDDYARLTPCEVAFPDRDALEDLSAEVAKEADLRGLDDSTPETFMTLVSVGDVVGRMRAPEAPPASTHAFVSLLFHGVHFVRAECPLYLVDTGAVRRLVSHHVDRDLIGGASVETPATAGYLQLPQHLVWTDTSAEATSNVGSADAVPESLDGVFWTRSGAGILNVLPVSGLRPDRPGFGALPLPAAPWADATTWLVASVRPSGDDFATSLPGGELDALYSVRAAGEILKLLARFFVFVGGRNARLEDRPGASPAASWAGAGGAETSVPPVGRVGAPRPSALAYTRVSLGG